MCESGSPRAAACCDGIGGYEMSKKLLSLLLALCLLASLVTIPAMADNETAETSGIEFYTSESCDAGSRIEPNSTVNYYTLPTLGTIWVNSAEKFGNDFSVTHATCEIVNANTVKLTLKEPGSSNVYNLTVSAGGTSAGLTITNRLGSGISVTVGGEKYLVGFAFDEGETMIVNDGTYMYAKRVTGDYDSDDPREKFVDARVVAGRIVEDEGGQTHFEFNANTPVSVEVSGMELRYMSGDVDTFSFAENGAVTRLDNVPGSSAPIYWNELPDTIAFVVATVTVTVKGGETITGAVGLELRSIGITEVTVTVAEGANAETISSTIANVVKNGIPGEPNNPDRGTIHVVLHGNYYEGTIVLPPNVLDTKGDYEIRFEPADGIDRATIVGGVNIGDITAASFYNIDFIAPDSDGETKALYGGKGTANNCTFQGYDVAMDAAGDESNTMSPYNCVFADNGIALRINNDAEPGGGYNSGTDFTGNVFINNDIAIQILDLGDVINPYYYRISGCNFVDNDVTFDVSHPGTFYFYRNYYGRVKNNAGDMDSVEILEALRSGVSGDIQRQPPKVSISEHSKTKVITNPRWKDPWSWTKTCPHCQDTPRVARRTLRRCH